MNGSLSDGNENIVDIFVLSTSTTDSPLQARDLEHLGYRATFFSDAQQLFESMRSGKPNLLICDSVTTRQDSYDLCRALKADYDLWVVPVLIVTSASSLSDLLHVLDCNADNFVSSPFDPSYFSALVEGMITTPVERPTPEQIKTQFKIQHDDQQFVVTADRRRLLEFLLSSFEIAVNRAGDIIRITSEKDGIRETLENREERVRDQARSIEALNGTLRQKEQAIGALQSEVTEKDHRILEDRGEIQKLQSEIETGKSHIAAAEGEIDRLTEEAAELARRYTEETGDLSRQLATISEHLAATSADLKAAEESLALESSKKTDIETLLSETAAQKEQAEKMAHELALEVEQAKADILAEKERVQNLVTEIAAITEAKSRGEEELTGTIRELKDTITKIETDLSLRTQEREDEKSRVTDLESRLADLTAAKQTADEALKAGTEAAARDLAKLQESLDQARTMLAGREQDLAGLKTELDRVTGAHRSAEEELTSEIRERDTSLQALQDQFHAAQGDMDGLRNELERVRSDLTAALATKSAAENSLEEASGRIRTLEAELIQARSSGAENQVQAESFRRSLEEAKAGIRELESGLAAEKSGNEVVEKQRAALAGELAQARTELADSIDARSSLEKALADVKGERDRIAAERERESGDRESLAAAIAKEEQARRDAEGERDRLRELLTSRETEGKTQESTFSNTIHELKAELQASAARQRDLEAQVAVLSQEKQDAEEKAASLGREIDQARTALADEWEGHMEAQERLVAAAGGETRTVTSPLPADELESEKAKKRELIVKGPDLPVSIGKHPQSLSAAMPPRTALSPVPQIRNVEDLFEDEQEMTKEAADLPEVSIIHELAGEEEQAGPQFPPVTGSDDEGLDPEPDDDTSYDDTAMDDYVPDEEDVPLSPSGEYAGGPPTPEIAFNRAQWFDLLKWAHHSGTLTQDQRMQIVKMGRLIQKGRKLTRRQEEQVKEMLVLVQAQGYRFV